MLSRCVNDQCCKPFLRLREGKLFLVETERLTKPARPRRLLCAHTSSSERSNTFGCAMSVPCGGLWCVTVNLEWRWRLCAGP